MTDSPLFDALELRFTEREILTSLPDVAAFSRVDRGLLHEQLAEQDDRSDLADLVAHGHLAANARVLVDCEPSLESSPVFVTLRATPIPAITAIDSTARPGLSASELDEVLAPVVEPAMFALADRVDGHFAWVPRERPRSRAAAAALLLSVAIPLAIPDVAAAQPATQRPTPAATPAPEPAPVAAPAPETAPPPATPTPTPIAAPATEGPAGPPPQVNAAVMQNILDNMRGHEAIVFARGGAVTGLIVGTDGDFVTMVDYDHEGRIAMIPKADVLEVRGKVKQKPPADMPDGTPALAGGGVMIGLGSPLMLSGLVFVAIIPSSPVVWAPQVLPAAILLGAGIPLLVRGMRQRRAYRAAYAGLSRLEPSFNRTRHGTWTGGLTLRF